MIVIFGAFGKTGRRVAAALRTAGKARRLVTRDPMGACEPDAAIADLSNEASLGRVLDGACAVYALLPDDFSVLDFHARRRNQVDALARAIERAGVPRVVAVSASTAALGEATGHGFGSDLAYLERRLSEVTGSLSVLRAPYFQDNVLHGAAVAAQGGVFPCFFPSRDRAITTAAAADVGDLAARVLLEPARSGCEIIDVTGPAYSTTQMADALGRALGRELVIADVPPAQQLAMFQRGSSPEAAQAMVETLDLLGGGALELRGERRLEAWTLLANTCGAIP